MPLMSFTSSTKQTTSSSTTANMTPNQVESRNVDDSPSATDKVSNDSEPQSLSQTFYPSLASLKDQRAYEHERQRVKKAADLAKVKARKGQWSLLAYDSKRTLSRSPTRTPEKTRRLRPEEVDALEGAPGNVNVGRGDVRDNGYRLTPATSSDTKSEVKLADLIDSGSFRKPKARKAKDSDYEVVPHVRSVIVLDDTATRDVTFDEPWEHIDHSDSDDSSSDSTARKEQPKTYASILSIAK